MSLPPDGRQPYAPQQPPGQPHPQRPYPQQPYPQRPHPQQGYAQPTYPAQPGYAPQPGYPPSRPAPQPGYQQPAPGFPPPAYQPPAPGSPQPQLAPASQQPGQPAPGQLPAPNIVHGSAGDPRYPSPRALRRALGFMVDLVLHLGCAVGVFFGSEHVPSLSHLPTVWAVVAWFVVSFVHRVLIQWGTQASLGKALFGLRMVRPVDGGRVGFGTLAKAWLVSIWATIVAAASLAGSTGNDNFDENSFMLPVVRRCDVR